MTKMQVSVLRGVGVVDVEERPMPEPAADEVLVKIRSVGVCGSDVHYYEHGRIGPYVVDSPLILGHEAGGVIAAIGADVTSLREGQRVSIEPGVPCRDCTQCRAGRYNLCPEVKFFATPPHDGAFSQYVAMPATFVYPVPDTISDDAAGLLEPLSVGVWACRRAHVAPGDTVLVTGAGPIGLLAAQTARAYGADTVVITDINPHRLELAERLGLGTLNVADNPLADAGLQPSVLLECSGNARATWDGVSSVARAGTVVLVGMGGDEVRLPLSYLQDRELVVTGAFRYANTWPTAIQLAASGRVNLDSMVTGHYGLHDVEQALTASRSDPSMIKAMVTPEATE
jgi:L-iditol 2-dehydrogenase